ncbi:hypothetical protein ACF0H5_012702 [Mactra antiquata]
MEVKDNKYKKVEDAITALFEAHKKLVARHEKLEKEFVTFKQHVTQNLCSRCIGHVSNPSGEVSANSSQRESGMSSNDSAINRRTLSTSNKGSPGFTMPSPVQLNSEPPTDVPRPQPNNMRKKPIRLTELCTSVKSRRLLLHMDEPQERDFINVLQQIGVDVNSSTIAAVASAAPLQSRSNTEWSRPVGLYTVLILDISSSITAQGFNMMKSFVNELLSGIEGTERQCELYEYVSVITCGAETGIVQHFTNDYEQVKSVIDHLTLNGRTPLMTALTLALCYLELQGESVMINRYNINPRIIIVSDFMLTSDQQPFNRNDDDHNDDRIQMSTRAYAFGSTFIKPHKYQVTCVPIGKCNLSVAKQFASSCDGNIVSNERDIYNVKLFYCYKMAGCCALSECERSIESGDERILDDIVMEYLSLMSLDQSCKNEVMNAIEKLNDEIPEFVDDIEQDARHSSVGNSFESELCSIQQPIPVLPDWNARSFDNISLEEVTGLLPLGTRVMRGEDWTSNNEDNNASGTIIGHKERSYMYVLWDNDQIGEYKYGVQGKYEVEMTHDCRKVQMGDIDIGCTVTRGADWERGDEDGGLGTTGIVVRKLRGRCVQVRWPFGVIETYRFGAENKWEVKVIENIEAPVTSNITFVPAKDSDLPKHSQTVSTNTHQNEILLAWWSWKDGSSNWRPFSEDNVRKLESKYNTGQDRCHIEYQNKSVNVFLKELRCDINGRRYELKREMVKQDDVESFKTLDSFLPPID